MPPELTQKPGRELKSGLIADDAAQVSLCETLDRLLNKGAVIAGEVTISVANVDLIHISLQLILTSIETARNNIYLEKKNFME